MLPFIAVAAVLTLAGCSSDLTLEDTLSRLEDSGVGEVHEQLYETIGAIDGGEFPTIRGTIEIYIYSSPRKVKKGTRWLKLFSDSPYSTRKNVLFMGHGSQEAFDKIMSDFDDGK